MDRIQLIGLAAASLMAVYGCGKSDFDSRTMKEIDNDLVCLGSWFGLNKHALAVRK